MRKELIEKLKKHHRAYEWLEANGYNPISAYGKYVIIEGGKTYKTFTEAADTINPNWDK